MDAVGLTTVDLTAAQAAAEARAVAENIREASNLRRELENIAPSGNLLARQLKDVDDRFITLRERAVELGVSLTLVTEAQARARAEATRQYEAQRVALQRELESVSPTGSALTLQLKEIDLRFADLRQRAQELGVALTLVDEAHARARAEAQRQYEERRSELLSQVENLGTTGLAKTLQDIRDQFRDLRKELDAVGLSTVDLTLKQREAEKRAIEAAKRQAEDLERTVMSQQRGIRDFFQGLIEPLRAANQNALAPIGQIEGARQRFRETAALAQGGDVEAIQNLGARTQELMGLRQQYLSSGGLGADILREVTEVTQSVIGSLEQQQREAEANIPDVIRETTSEHIRVLIEENKKTLEELAAIRQEIARATTPTTATTSAVASRLPPPPVESAKPQQPAVILTLPVKQQPPPVPPPPPAALRVPTALPPPSAMPSAAPQPPVLREPAAPLSPVMLPPPVESQKLPLPVELQKLPLLVELQKLPPPPVEGAKSRTIVVELQKLRDFLVESQKSPPPPALPPPVMLRELPVPPPPASLPRPVESRMPREQPEAPGVEIVAVDPLELKQREAMASVPDVIRQTMAEQIRVLVAENRQTRAELVAIKRELTNARLKAA